jgi:signal transduction histidine kinase
VDESGIPLALYAARQLLERDSVLPEVLDAIRGALGTNRWLPPGALYLLRDLADTLQERAPSPGVEVQAGELAREALHELVRTEQALALKREFPSLGIRIPNHVSNDLETRWITYGDSAWFVGAAPVGDRHEGLVLGIRVAPLLASLESDTNAGGSGLGRVAILTENGEGIEPLGSAFPGIFVGFDAPEGGWGARVGSTQWWFYAAGLLLVFGVTFFGAYLLWRDVRREVQLAETRSRFVAAVSHELKTPLTAIRMFAETLRDNDSPPPDTQGEYLDTIVNESERLTRLLNNVLDFSKIEGGRKTYRFEYQPLQEIVRFTARAMRYPLEQKRFVLHLDIEASVPPVLVDRDAIEQALLNLLANAMKYSGDSRDIQLRLRSENGQVVLEVADQGVGIDPTDVPRIFDRFFRVERPENDRVPGAGLGLTLVQHIAEAHGGRVAVKSEPGSGSTFSLFLPVDGARA